MLYKYMPASRILEILENKPHQIGFVPPEKWYDPYETKYLNTDYTALNGYKQPKVYCFCVRTDNFNEEASWKIYQKANDPLIRISIITNYFLLSLDLFAQEYKCDLYFSKVDYKLRKDIDDLYLPSSQYHHEFFGNFNDKQYVKVMSLKRKAFTYENEYRIFLIPRNQFVIRNFLRDGILFVPISLKMFNRFTIHPRNKIGNSFAAQIEKAQYDAECKLIKERICKSYPEAKVYISNLYSRAEKIKRIET